MYKSKAMEDNGRIEVNLLEWVRERRQVLNIKQVEEYCGIPSSTLAKAIKREADDFSYYPQLRRIYELMRPEQPVKETEEAVQSA